MRVKQGSVSLWITTASLTTALAAMAGCSTTRASQHHPQASAHANHAVDASLIERFVKIRTPGAATLAADGTLFVRDLPDGVFQVYRYPGGVANLDSPREQLTKFKDGASGYSLSPDGSRLIITASVGGNENNQIYTLDPKAAAGTEPSPITAKPKVQYAPNLWLHDSSGLIFTGNDDSPTDFWIYKHDFATGQRTTLLKGEGSWSAGAITRDGARLLVSRYISASNSSVYELDVASGALKDISVLPAASGDAQATAANDVVGYMPGEQAALIISDAEGGSRSLYVRDLATGVASQTFPQFKGAEVDEAGMNHEQTLLTVVLNKDGYGELHLFELPSLKEVTLPTIEAGVVAGVSLRDRRLIWTLSNARTPGLAFECTVPQREGGSENPLTISHARQITFTDTQGIELKEFALPSLVRYKSFDGVEIPAFVYVPSSYTKNTPIPFIVLYHGGPEGQHRPVYTSTVPYLLTQGYGVMMPNVRGSTGYGRTFHMMDDYKKRWDSVRDGVDAAAWLVRNNFATPGKIATMGGSYGGFMSVACLVEDQERVERGEQKQRLFGAGLDNVGIVNMKTFLEQTSGYRRKLREVEYGPLTDPAFLESISPLNRIDKIKVPMLISHGLNDPRVPVGEAMQLASGLQRRGFDPEQVYFADEGHGAQKIENRLLYIERVARFLNQHLKGGS